MTVNNTYLYYRNTFYWDKRAFALYPGDFSKAKVTRWLNDYTKVVGVKDFEKRPLESRVWYNYPGSSSPQVGTTAQPTKIGRVLDDGSTQLYQYEHNSLGKVTRETDPAGRATIYNYDTNGIDLLEVRQVNGQTTDLLGSRTYNSQHLPLAATDRAGQTITYTYFPNGMLQTIVTPPRAGLSQAERTRTYNYYPDSAPMGPGRSQTIAGPSGPQGSPTTTFTYDSYGRLRTTTNPDSYMLTFDYDVLDRPTKTTYPDGTYDQTVYSKLDAEGQRDRLGRWSYAFHDALRRVASTRDAAGRTVTQEWCNCGSLDKLIDPNGNATTWDRDLQSRVTKETSSDNSYTTFTYEATTSRLKTRTDARNQTTTYTYKVDDNVGQVSYTNAVVATPIVNYSYDPVYNRIVSMTDGTGTTNYSYHPAGVLGAGGIKDVDGPLTNDTISYTYDELGRTVTRGLSGFTTTSSYFPVQK